MKKNDYELQRDTVKMYFESKSAMDFYKELKEYIKDNKLSKTPAYLKRLLEEYKRRVLKETLEYEMVRNTQEIHRIESSYKTMVEKMISMTDEELMEYIKNNNINGIRIKLENYIKFTKDEKKIEIAKQTLEQVNDLYNSIKTSSNLENEKQRYEKAIEVFDTMVNKGFFNYTDFKTTMNKYFGCDSVEMDKLLTSSRTLLRTKYPEKMQEYKNKLEKNKLKFYILHQNQIKNMIIGIRHGTYDIVDYYINFKMSPKVFESLYYSLTDKKIISNEDKIMLNKFFKKYNERMREECHNDNHGKPIECNGTIRYEEGEFIKEFMEQHGIPEKYFKLCYKKYKKNELKMYFGRQLTRNIPIK